MSWDYVPGKNAEGYPDPTAAAALSNVQRSQRGLQSKRAGEHFENMIAASLGWYKDKGVRKADDQRHGVHDLNADLSRAPGHGRAGGS